MPRIPTEKLFVITCLSVSKPEAVEGLAFQAKLGWRTKLVSAASKEEAIEKSIEVFKEEEPDRVFSQVDGMEINNDTISQVNDKLCLKNKIVRKSRKPQ